MEQALDEKYNELLSEIKRLRSRVTRLEKLLEVIKARVLR